MKPVGNYELGLRINGRLKTIGNKSILGKSKRKRKV